MMSPSNSFRFKKLFFLISTGFLLANASSNAAATSNVPAKAGYFPVEIQNNIGSGASKNGVKDVYLLFSGEQVAAPSPQCLMQLTADPTVTGYNAWKASCQNLTMNTQASQFSYPMSKLQATSGDPVVIYIPNVISGRAFVSLNYPLDLPMTRAANGTVSIQAPSLGNPNDGNYNLIYDKFEYTYDAKDRFWIDTTSVDDFSLPIALAYNSTQNGYTGQSRTDILNGIEKYLGEGTSDWKKLLVKDSVSGTGTIMRVDAPNTSPNFNPNYLTAQSGFNYVNTLINYYSQSGNTLSIDCSEVDVSTYPEYARLGSGTDPAAYQFTGTVVGKQFVFQNQTTIAADKMSVNIDLSQATSGGFFGPGQPPLDTPNQTVRSVIVKNLTAASSVGLLPAPAGTYLKSSFFQTAFTGDQYYKKNTILENSYSPGTGPWYDLYAKAIHKTAANNVYAFAFDDVLKQDGTIEVNNANSGATVQPVVITFGSVGNLQVPQPGSNYTPNPPKNDLYAVSNVQQTGFSCSGGNCTVSATWQVPSHQDKEAQYFLLMQPSPETPTVLKSQTLQPYNATGMSVTYPVKPAPSSLTQITVYSCILSKDSKATGSACPTPGNKYTFGPTVQGASSAAKGVVLLPVTPLTNSGFSCSSGHCTLNATWTVPAAEPSGTTFYILPQNNKNASIIDILDGQNPMPTGGSGTLVLPAADVNHVNAPIIVMACINSGNKYCPGSGNSYDQSTGVGSSILAPTS